MYALVYKGRVINGPRDWNKYQFEGALEKEGIFFQVGRNPPFEDEIPILINEDAKILRARYEYPEYNRRIQSLDGPFWEFAEKEAIGRFNILYQGIEFIRNNLKQALAENRWRREVAGIEVEIQNNVVKISTNREDRNQFEILRNSGADNVLWKFNDIWLTLTSTDIATLADAVKNHVQITFDWEKEIFDLIDLTEIPEEFEAIDIGDPVIERPQRQRQAQGPIGE
jgi:hypothetical protein